MPSSDVPETAIWEARIRGFRSSHAPLGERRLWCLRSNWLAARTADRAIQLDGLSPTIPGACFRPGATINRAGCAFPVKLAAPMLLAAGLPDFGTARGVTELSRPQCNYVALPLRPDRM